MPKLLFSRLLIPLTTLVVGIAASVAAHLGFREVESARQQANFTRLAEQHVAALQGQMESVIARVQGLQQFHAASGAFDAESFARFVQPLAHDQRILAYQWAPRVARQERAAFEAAARRSGLSAYAIRDLEKGNLIEAASREEYFPVRLTEPLNGNHAILGLDFASELNRRTTLSVARDSGQATVSAPVDLVQGGRGLLVMAPCYARDRSIADTEGRRRHLQGIVVGVVRFEDIATRAFAKIPPGADLLITDSLIAGDAGVLYLHRSGTNPSSRPHGREWFQESPLQAEHTLLLAGHEFDLRIVATPEFLAQDGRSLSLLVLFGGLLLTAISSALSASLLQRKQRVEHEVTLRTSALQDALLHLGRSEEHHRAVFEQLRIPMLVTNPADGQIIDANFQAERFYGYKREALRGMSIGQINRLPFDAIREAMAEVVAGKRNLFQFSHRLASGEIRQVEAHSTPITLDGQCLLYSVISDITERKRSEALLRLQSMAVDAAANAIVITDREGRIERVNRAFSRITGYEPEEAIGRQPTDLIGSGLHPPEFFAEMWATILAGKVWSGELCNRRKDGTLYDEQQTIAPVWDETGAISHFVAIKQDVTEHNRARAELASERQRLADIIRGTHVGTWEWDLQSGQMRVNQRWAEIIGYTLEELEPIDIQTWQRLAHPEDRQRSSELLERHFRQELDYYEIEARMLHKDGHWVWVLGRGGVSHRAEDGQPLRMSGTHQDISARKQAEAALIEAKQHAEAASLAKSRFLATMSHEIRTPLNGILGMAQMLLQPGLPERDQRTFARTIYNSGQTLLALLNDILDLSKVEAGKLELALSGFSPAQILDETAALFSESANQKQLQLKVHWAGPTHQHYRGDPVRLRQMLANLLGNALKFTARGQITVRASEVSRQADSATLHFSVSDTGIGIAPAQSALLFQPFSQLDNSDTRQYGGTGLGLSIVRSLAELMHGEVGVSSVEGEGSTFWFTVQVTPLGEQHERRTLQREPSAAPLPLNPPLGARRILVMEDNPTNLKVLRAMLATQGIAPQHAENGLRALELVRSSPAFELILMDCQMPVMDGFEASRQIRAWEQSELRPPVPIVAITAGAFSEDRQLCQQAGMNDFLAKPLDYAKLVEMLGKWLPDPPPSSTPQPVPLPVLPQDALPSFNPADLMRRLGHDRNIALIAIQAFIDDHASLLAALEAALAANQAKEARRHAHSLKGAAANTSGLALAACAREVELACSEERLDDARARLPTLKAESACFLAALQDFLAQPG